jgi:hypothetical protein
MYVNHATLQHGGRWSAATIARRVALLAVLAVPAMQSQSAPSTTSDVRGAPLPERLAPATRSQIVALVDSLTAERLPAFALRDKAAEGVLKGADDPRILAAVRALAQRLRTSRQLLGADASADGLQAAASAIFAGVPSASITRLVSAHRARRPTVQTLSVPLGVIAELASSRVPPDVALTSVDALLARGAVDADLRAFRATVDRDIRQGRAPRDAAADGLQRSLRGLDRVP